MRVPKRYVLQPTRPYQKPIGLRIQKIDRMLSRTVTETAQNIMRWANSVCENRELLATLLGRLPKARFCIQARFLSHTAYNEEFDFQKKAAGSSTLVSSISYWRAEVKEIGRGKTTLTFRHRLHRFVEISLESLSALKTLQQAMGV